MNRILHTCVLLRDRTLAFTWRSAWRWTGIDTSDKVSAIVALLILLAAYGVVRD